MRIFGLTVGRNEVDRYLIPSLMHSLEILDDVFFWDDRSTDGTAEVAMEHLNCSGGIRSNDVPSFLEDEGAFRGAAWMGFEAICSPRPGDWVLVVDCDEALIAWDGWRGSDVREALEKVIHAAGSNVAVDLNVPEVFGFAEDGCPLIRVDRLWGTIHAPRLFAYRPGGFYSAGQMGVPAVPSYVMGSQWFQTDTLALLHYGYAEEKDQFAKYDRYVNHHGHSSEHVASILADDKELVRWDWPYPPRMSVAWTQQSTSS